MSDIRRITRNGQRLRVSAAVASDGRCRAGSGNCEFASAASAMSLRGAGIGVQDNGGRVCAARSAM